MLEGAIVNVSGQDVAQQGMEQIFRYLREERLIPHAVVQQLRDSLGLHDAQDEDTGGSSG